jgi:hypothetical protein
MSNNPNNPIPNKTSLNKADLTKQLVDSFLSNQQVKDYVFDTMLESFDFNYIVYDEKNKQADIVYNKLVGSLHTELLLEVIRQLSNK